MGQVYYGSAPTTAAIRRSIQHSQESLRALAKHYEINQKTVAKWKKRTSVADLPTGPKEPRSTVLSVEEEAVIVAFRRYTLLPLDDGWLAPLRIRPCLAVFFSRAPAVAQGFPRLPGSGFRRSELKADLPDVLAGRGLPGRRPAPFGRTSAAMGIGGLRAICDGCARG